MLSSWSPGLAVIWVLSVGMLAGVIWLVVSSLQAEWRTYPSEIDAVIWAEAGVERAQGQVRAIARHMTWIRRIWVLYRAPVVAPTESIATWVDVSARAGEAHPNGMSTERDFFWAIPHYLPEAAEHVVYLSHRTWPMRQVLKSYMFCVNRPRVFNLMEDAAEQLFHTDSHVWQPVSPVFVARVSDMKTCDTFSFEDYILDVIHKRSLTLRRDLNWHVFVKECHDTASRQQLYSADQARPLFVTVHVGGTTDTAELTRLSRDVIQPWLDRA